MSKTVTYRCNLCNETKPPSELYSMYWDSTKQVMQEGNSKKFGAYVLDTDARKSDRHVCFECCAIIKETTTKTQH